ncbi:MAG: copper resistance CopC family protein [Mycobacteriaceae bacterium]|uniref:copper resistance CopC family protein n=1 Tax=Corynebacterium sp. TaxID=1720 RepID=UPI003F9B1503
MPDYPTSPVGHPRGRRFLAAPVVAGLLIMSPMGMPIAAAHDAVTGGSPEPESTVTEAPETIELEFSGEPQDTFNTIALSTGGDVVVSDTPEIDGHNLSLDIPQDAELHDGEYTVGYRITSSDGHPTDGSYTFTLDTAGDASAAAESAGDASEAGANDDDADEGLPSWAGPVLGVTGVVVVLGALAVAINRYRHLGKDGDGDSES